MRSWARLMGGLVPLVAIAAYLTAGICGRVTTVTADTAASEVHITVTSVTDNGATYDYATQLSFVNTGDLDLTNVVLQDTLRTNGGTMAILTWIAVTHGTATLDSTWDGTTANPDIFLSPTTVASGDSVTVTYTVRVTHGGNSGPWYSEAWGYADGGEAGITPTDAATASYIDPSPPIYSIGLAMKLGTVTFTGSAYTMPCSLITENLGTEATTAVQIIYGLALAFTGTSSLTSVTVPVSTSLSVNTGFDGGTDRSIYQGSQVLASAALDTAAFVATFDAGSEAGPFTTAGYEFATFAGGNVDTDSSDCGGNPDPDGDGESNELGENDRCTISLPTTTTQIGIAKYMGAVGGVSGAYTVPCTLIVENLGDTDLTSVDVRDSVDAIFGGTSSLTSITSITSTSLTANASFAGTSANDSVLTVLATDTLAAAGLDTLAFVITFDEGDQTEFFNNAWSFADGPGISTTEDESDWGTNPDPSGNGMPDDLNEDTPTRFAPPLQGTTDHDIVVSRASASTTPIVVGVTFEEGQYDSTQALAYGGDGFAVRDSVPVEYDTDFTVSLFWPDGSIRMGWLAFDPPRNGTYDIVALGAPQVTTPVDTTSDPGFTIDLNGDTYTFVASDFAEESPDTNCVYRYGYAEKDDATADYEGQEGGLKVMFWRSWFADGSARNLIGIRCENVATTPISSASNYSEAIAADWEITRTSTNVFQVRWADEMGLGSGGDTTTTHLWHSGSYDYTPYGDPSYNYGGQLRPGEDLWVEVVEGAPSQAPVAFETANWYKTTKGVPYTDLLHVFSSGTSWASADSLLGYFESISLNFIEGVDSETPWAPYWENVRDHGEFNRQFDASIYFGHNTGQDQYEMNLGFLKNALGMARVSSDTLSAHSGIPLTCWDMFEKSARNHELAKYNLNYSGSLDARFAYFNTWGHADHGGSGLGQQARGGNNQSPGSNYMHGIGIYPLYYLTWAPHLAEYMAGKEALIHYYAISVWGGGWAGEFRSGGNGMNWATMIYDLGGAESEDLSDLMVAIRNCIGNRDWGIDPTDPCGTSWFNDKPWQLNYAMSALRNAVTCLYRWGDTPEAVEAEGYFITARDFLWDYGWDTYTDPLYEPEGVPRDFDSPAYSWGICKGCNDGDATCPPNAAICGSGPCGANHACCYLYGGGAPDFWAVNMANTMADHSTDPNSGSSFFECGILHRGAGYEGFQDYNNEFQKMGVPFAWGGEYLALRESPAQAKSQSQQNQERYED